MVFRWNVMCVDRGKVGSLLGGWVGFWALSRPNRAARQRMRSLRAGRSHALRLKSVFDPCECLAAMAAAGVLYYCGCTGCGDAGWWMRANTRVPTRRAFQLQVSARVAELFFAILVAVNALCPAGRRGRAERPTANNGPTPTLRSPGSEPVSRP